MDHHYDEQNMAELTRTTCANTNNIVNKSQSQSQSGYSFKFEHIVDFSFLNDTNCTIHSKDDNKDPTQQYSSRLFLGNHVSCSIKSHFAKKHHYSRHSQYRHNGSGAISIPDELYHEVTSLECQILNLLQYEYLCTASITDIHIVYLQPIHCLGLLLYTRAHTPLSLPIFNKYFNVIGFIDHKCTKYWECPHFKCRYQLNKIKDINDVVFFCDKCNNDFTFQHNPNNHHYYRHHNHNHNHSHLKRNKKIRSCIKYRFLSLSRHHKTNHHKINSKQTKNVYNNNRLFAPMSHDAFQQLSAAQSRNHDIETEKKSKPNCKLQPKTECDWIDRLMLHNLEQWFDHTPGTKIGLNDYQFDMEREDDDEYNERMRIISVRCRDSEGERHGVDHECMACKPSSSDHDLDMPHKTWLCSLCQKTIPIDIKTCICISSENANHQNNNHNNEYKSDKHKDCLIVIKELAETLHSTISFNEIPQEFKTSSKPFEYQVCFNGEMIANGHGNSKRKAQRNGAEVALNILSLRGDEIKRKIHLLQQFDRIGHCEIDPNLFVEVCADVSDQKHMYCIRPMHEYHNSYVMNPRCLRHVVIDETPDIVAYRTRTFEISHLEEPSVLGCLDVRGPLKFSLVCGIFHKDVNNGRYGYNYNERKREKRDKKKRKSNKRRRKSNKRKTPSVAIVADAAINTINPNEVDAALCIKEEEVTTFKWIGLQRHKNTYSHPSKYIDHEIYSRENSPRSQHKQSKRRRNRRMNLKLENHGVYICCECDKYYADNSNGRYLSQFEAKWFCFECLKKMKDAHLAPFLECSVYIERKNVESKDAKTVTPPMTPPSSEDDNNHHYITSETTGDVVFEADANLNLNSNHNKETAVDPDASLFGPHTPSSPSLSEVKAVTNKSKQEDAKEEEIQSEGEQEEEEEEEEEDAADDCDDDETSDSESPVKTVVETVSTAIQCDDQIATEHKNNEAESSIVSTSTVSVSSPISDQHAPLQDGSYGINDDADEWRENATHHDLQWPKVYHHNKAKMYHHNKRKYKDKYQNNFQMHHPSQPHPPTPHHHYHHHNGYYTHHHHHHHPSHIPPLHHPTAVQPMQPPILYAHAPPYNLQNSWNAYYGHQHKNATMFMDNLHPHNNHSSASATSSSQPYATYSNI